MSSQNEEITKLKRKLETYNSIVTERNELRDVCEQIEIWKKTFENGHKKVFMELKALYDVESEKLKKAMDAKYEWNLKFRKLQDVNDCMSNQIKTLRLNENKLHFKLSDYKQIIEKLTKDLSNAKLELDEGNCVAEQLKMNLKSKENELCDVRRELDYRSKECERLNKMNSILDKDLKCIEIKLYEAKESAARMEENLTLELKKLFSESKIKGEILSEIEVQYDKAKCEINSEKNKVKQLTENLSKVFKEKECDQFVLKNEIMKLKKENCSKDEHICNLKKKIEKLLQENKGNVMEKNALKIQIEERECQLNLKQMKLLSERLEGENQTILFCSDTNTESISVTNTSNENTEINNLNRELDQLKKHMGIDFTN